MKREIRVIQTFNSTGPANKKPELLDGCEGCLDNVKKDDIIIRFDVCYRVKDVLIYADFNVDVVLVEETLSYSENTLYDYLRTN